ncbi:MAG: hypothetical protein ACJA2Z_000303 [Candidatus Paceibacteria bacterium]|jgi:hypothetical protein
MDDITPKKKIDRIDALDRELYDPAKEHAQRARRKIHGRDIELEHDFTDDEYDKLINERVKYQLPTSLFKKTFFAVLSFFLVTIVIAGISLYEGKAKVSGDLIAMEILGQPFVDGGEELELEVRIQNFNEQDLQLPDLVLSYPKDSAVDAEHVFLRRSLQDIGPGKRVTEEFDLILFGQEGDNRSIDATLEYRIEGSSSIFIKEFSHDVIIRSTPTQVLIDAPDSIVRNQELVFGINIASNSTAQVNNTALKITYPRGFEFLRSNISPDFNNNTWYFSNIDQDVERIEFTGRLAALEGQGQSFNIEFGKQNQFNKNQIETVFNSIIHTVDIQKSFIDAQLIVNNSTSSTSTIRGGSSFDVTVGYENTLDVALDNTVIEVNLSGDLYDRSEINTQDGFYNSSTRSIVFDGSTNDRLSRLEPGEQGQMRFTVGTKPLVGASGILSNPQAELSVDVTATEQNGNNRQALGISSHTVLANSDISVNPKILYYDGLFENNGPVPPRANLPTTYTLVFQVSNSSNDVSNAELTTTLPNFVEWTNNIAPSVERNNVSYDRNSRKLTWKLDRLSAGLGTGTVQPRQLSVQIEVTPSLSQVGADLEITGETLLSGFDEFTEAQLNFRRSPLSNSLQEARAPTASGRVTE